MKLPEQEKIRRFAERYLQTMSPDRAAEAIGRADGMALLGKPAVQEEIERQRRLLEAQTTRADAVRQLYRLAFGRCNDCVRLVMEEAPELGTLDLSMLSELRRSDKGALDVKLLNRTELLRLLLGLTEERGDGAAELLRALGEDAP